MLLRDGVTAYIGVILLLAVVLAYANTPFNGFVWDDDQIIINNPVNRNMKNIDKIFSSADVAFSDDTTPYFRPLNRLTYMLDYRMFGLNPFWYHVENILIHFTNVLLLYHLLARKLFKRVFPAIIAALLFAIHPVNAEAVNFISGRNNLLAVFFVLLSIIVYLRGAKKRGMLHILGTGVCFFAGILCKETALMLIPVLFYIAFAPFSAAEHELKGKAASFASLFLFALLYFVMRFYALSGTSFNLQWRGVWERVAQNIYVIPKYMSLIFFPANLNAAYTIPRDYLSDGLWLAVAWSAIALGVIYLLRMKNAAVTFGLYWFALTFIPISNIVPIPSATMAERYLYMPAIGIWILVGGVLEQLAAEEKARKVLLPAFAIVCILLVALTFNRNKVWINDFTLFASMVKSDPDSAYGHYNLGNAYRESGDLARARQEWEKTVALNQNHSRAWNQLGSIYLSQNSFATAEQHFSRALRADQANSEAHYNLATVLEELGRPGEALRQYEQFLQKVPPEHKALILEVAEKILQLKKQTVAAGQAK